MLEQFYIIIIPIYIILCISFPELNLILFLFIGRIQFEARLGFYEYFSLNHINLLILLIHLLWTIKLNKVKHRVKFTGIYIYILFVIWLCISFLFHSNNIDYAFNKIIATVFVTFASTLFLIIRYQYLGNVVIEHFIVFFALVGLGMAMIGFIALTQGYIGQRLAVLGGGPNVFARIIGSTILIISIYYNEIKRYISRFYIIALMFGLIIVQISTLSKGPLLSLLLMFGILFLVFNRHRSVLKNTSITIAITGLVFAIMIFFNLSERYFLNPFDDVSYGSYGTRFQHIIDSIEIFKQNPIVGIGLGDFVDVSKNFTYPHNILLEVLTELGMIGLLIFLSIIFIYFKAILDFIKNRFNDTKSMFNYKKVFIILSLFMTINQLVSGDLIDARFMLFLIVFSIILNQRILHKF